MSQYMPWTYGPAYNVPIMYYGVNGLNPQKMSQMSQMPGGVLVNSFSQRPEKKRKVGHAPGHGLAHGLRKPTMMHKFSVNEPYPSNEPHKVVYPIHQPSDKLPAEVAASLKKNVYPHIAVKKYLTLAIDQVRNFLVVYEYQVNGHWVIWDYELGFVHLTGIWKASLNEPHNINKDKKSHSKADIVKLLELTPKHYHPYIKRIRGGFLKIQGTWLPFNLCKVLARRFCYHIRYELVPIFGPDFPDYCLKPTDVGYGELKLDDVLEPGNPSGAVSPKRKRRHPNAHARSHSLNHPYSTGYPSTTVHPRTNYTHPPPKLQRSLSGGLGRFLPSSHPIPHQMIPLPVPPALQQKRPVYDELGDPFVHKRRASPSSSTSLPALSPLTPLTPLTPPTSHASNSPHRDMSYNEVVDLVNASKCLQSIKLHASPYTPVHLLPIKPTNYLWQTVRTPVSPTALSPPRVPEYPLEGISSILVAAGIHRRPLMKIDDLLS